MSKPLNRPGDAAASGQRLQGNLDRLAGDGGGVIQRWRVREEFAEAAGIAPLLLFVLPLLLLLVQLTRGLFGGAPNTAPLWLIALLAILGPVLYVALRVGRVYYRYHPKRQSALALYDAELRTHDRLVIADEFLSEGSAAAEEHSRGFRLAAVADAEHYAHSALNAVLSPLSAAHWQVRRTSWLGVPAALLVGALLYLGIDGSSVAEKRKDAAVLAALGAATPEFHSAKDGKGETLAAKLRQLLRRAPAPPEQQDEQQQAMQEMLAAKTKPRSDKGAEGESNVGTSAMTQSTSTSSNSAGQPSSERNASKPKEPEKPKPEEKDQKEDKKKPKKKEEQKSTQLAMSSTSGEGRMSMSASAPSQFDTPEREDKAKAGAKQGGQDQESEDEDEQEKSNSVTKPNISKAKKSPSARNSAAGGAGAPIIRSMKESKGKGRSGASPRKKTRGVPSMILGVPVPDRIKGMPNTGRSKVTQEDAKPKQENHPAMEAQNRLTRADEIGEVAHPGLLPWMQRLVRGYFITMRSERE